ncbi:MAG TPA: NAD(P)H-dependent oxidoreductase subunit E [Candidatus Angelobacter sp.]
MDLHLGQAQATHEETHAVDSALGIPHDGIHPGRDLLLPTLHAIRNRVGWLSAGALNYVASRLDVAPAEIYGVASFYGLFSLSPLPPVAVHVCDDIGCLVRGADKLCSQLEGSLGPAGSLCAGGRATWLRSACLGLCERAPAALISAAGEKPGERVLAPATSEGIQSLIKDAVAGKLPAEPDTLDHHLSVPQAGSPNLRLLRRVGKTDPENLGDYRANHGYEALQMALDLGPDGVINKISDSGLVGRGGAAFPTARKWQALHAQRHLGLPQYIICNADESEPGTFKDRILMEGDPFAVLEGMTIAGLATGAQHGYIYLRGEYPLAAERLTHALDSARKNGLLGKNILGRGLHFDIELRRGAGAYICGEETALFNSIEGYRGEPRNKPPFPTQSGLFRRPTAVNNVETLINVPEIIRGGGSAKNAANVRLFCLCGHIVHPGVYEIEMGMKLRDLITLAGGVGGNGRLQAVLLGGAAGAFVSPKELDTPLTFEATRAIGATLGSGVVMLFDDSVDLKQILLRIAAFFRHETCGQCVPCRVGVVRQEEALQRLFQGKPIGSAGQEISMLKEMAQAMRDASICGLGQTAASAVESALQRWSLFP